MTILIMKFVIMIMIIAMVSMAIYNFVEELKKFNAKTERIILKTDPCQFETKGMNAVGCDPVKVKDIGDGGWHIPDDWDEFELRDSKGNIKYYKRNDDGILKQVLK